MRLIDGRSGNARGALVALRLLALCSECGILDDGAALRDGAEFGAVVAGYFDPSPSLLGNASGGTVPRSEVYRTAAAACGKLLRPLARGAPQLAPCALARVIRGAIVRLLNGDVRSARKQKYARGAAALAGQAIEIACVVSDPRDGAGAGFLDDTIVATHVVTLLPRLHDRETLERAARLVLLRARALVAQGSEGAAQAHFFFNALARVQHQKSIAVTQVSFFYVPLHFTRILLTI